MLEQEAGSAGELLSCGAILLTSLTPYGKINPPMCEAGRPKTAMKE